MIRLAVMMIYLLMNFQKTRSLQLLFLAKVKQNLFQRKILNPFFLQKIRHVSSGINYNKRNKIILSIFYSFSVFWYLLVPIVLINQKQLLVLSTLVVLKKTTMYSLIRRIFIKIGVDVRPSMILMAEFYSVFIHGFAIIVTIFKSKKGKW